MSRIAIIHYKDKDTFHNYTTLSYPNPNSTSFSTYKSKISHLNRTSSSQDPVFALPSGKSPKKKKK